MISKFRQRDNLKVDQHKAHSRGKSNTKGEL